MQHHSHPRLLLVAAIATAICRYTHSAKDRFALACLSRLPNFQAAALFVLLGGSLSPVRSVAALDLLRRHLLPFRFDPPHRATAMDSPASLETLQWWKDCGLDPWYTKMALISASRLGKIHLLQWWKDSGLPLKYDARAAEAASATGQVVALQWWKDSGLPLEYDNYALEAASRNGHVRALDWWKESGHDLKFAPDAVVAAAVGFCRIDCLEWWLRCSGMEMEWPSEPFLRSSSARVLEWWREAGLFERWLALQPSVDEAFCRVFDGPEFARRPVPVQEWWRAAQQAARYPSFVFLWADAGRHIRNCAVVEAATHQRGDLS